MLNELQKKVAQFRDERNWRKFHTPKDLSMAICSEAGELADLYLWERTPDNYRISLEMADIAIFLLSLADVTGIDLAAAIETKLRINAKNYPVEKSVGNCAKKS